MGEPLLPLRSRLPVGAGLPETPVTAAVKLSVELEVALAGVTYKAIMGTSFVARAITMPPFAWLPSQLESPG